MLEHKEVFLLKIHFWGVRGSIPAPLTPQQIQAKINAVVQRIQEKDLISLETRERFIASLPDWIYGTTGGNTPCVQITGDDGQEIILDAGSGIRQMAKSVPIPKDMHYSLFFSHYHWDHIQGLPFFDAAYNPNITIDVYSPFEDSREILSNQMIRPYFPVDFSSFTKRMQFHYVHPGTEFEASGLTVNCCRMSHPGGSYSYAFMHNDRKFVYATDVELADCGFDNDEAVKKIFYCADAVVLDSQYTLEEAYAKEKWGHSAFCYAIDFAAKMNVKGLYLFHHEPTYDDKKINGILQAATWYSEYVSQNKIEVHLAKEGTEIEL